ncbi:hypothetical protein ACFLXB_08880 [Chloroflexota bacterium]
MMIILGIFVTPLLILTLLGIAIFMILLLLGGDPIKVKGMQIRREIDIRTDQFLDDIQTFLEKEKEHE